MSEDNSINGSIAMVANKQGMRHHLRAEGPKVWPLLMVDVAVHLLFLAIGAKNCSAGEQVDLPANGDIFSCPYSFLNLISYGCCLFSPIGPEAVERQLAHPFFFGMSYAMRAVADAQVVIDTLGVRVIYAVTARLSAHRITAALAGGGSMPTDRNSPNANSNGVRQRDCNAVVARGFRKLIESCTRRHPVRARVEVPLTNLQKIVLKNPFEMANRTQLILAHKSTLSLCDWRSSLFVSGVAGA